MRTTAEGKGTRIKQYRHNKKTNLNGAQRQRGRKTLRKPKLKQLHKTARRSKVDNKTKEQKQNPRGRTNDQDSNERHPNKLAKTGQ